MRSPSLRALPGLVALGLLAVPVRAQVALHVEDGRVVVTNAGGAQVYARGAAKLTATTGWTVGGVGGAAYAVLGADSVGFTAGGGGGSSSGGSGSTGSNPVVVVGGYDETGGGGGGSSSGGSGSTGSNPVIIAGGYDSALRYLRERYGAVTVRDSVLGVDYVTLPGHADPLGTFFRAVAADTLLGHPLHRFFRLLDVAAGGVFEDPAIEAAKTAATPLVFPNDRYYRLQWGVRRARLVHALWHSVVGRKRVRLAIIDSGVGQAERAHAGLDGAEIGYVNVAPTTGTPVAHGLEVATLFADRGHDGEGTVGLLGGFNANVCVPLPPIYDAGAPALTVYNVGDFGPVNVYVARAIRAAAADGADVITLSLHLAPSPVVAEAIAEAQAAGVIVVAAAGNYAPDAADKPARFPANLDGVIAVGSANADLVPSAFSARTGVDLYAPGDDVVVGAPRGLWVYVDGTSFAAPHVAAAVALMRAANPAVTADGALAAFQAYGLPMADGAKFLNGLSALNAVLPADVRMRQITFAPGCSITAALAKGETFDEAFAYDDRIDDALFPEAPLATPGAGPLHAAYPNPTAGAATLAFRLDRAGAATLAVYDALGREVARPADGPFEAGLHRVRVDTDGLGAGLYLVRLTTGGATATRPLTVVH